MGNYIVFKGIYDTADLYTEEITAVLRKKGHRVHTLHVDTMAEDLTKMMRRFLRADAPDALPGATPEAVTDAAPKEDEKDGENAGAGADQKAAPAGGIDGVFTFNNIGYNMGAETGGNLWDALGAVYYDIIMDHPFHYADKLRQLPKKSIVFCIDRNHVTYIRRFIPEVPAVRFLPHGGCRGALLPRKGDAGAKTLWASLPAPTAPRDIDVLYAGNLSRVLLEQLIPDFGAFPELDGAAFSETVLTRLIKTPSLTTEEVMEEELKKRLPFGMEDARLSRYIHAFRFLDGFAVSYYRELAVRVLVEHGVRVHVLGLGWETCPWSDHPNLIHIGKVDAPEVLSYMKKAKIVLNTLTWFKDGTHDRIFNGMLSGALVISDGSKYLYEAFRNHEQIELFSLEEIFGLPALVKKYLSEDALRQSVAAAGQKAACRAHTWEARVSEIFACEPFL